MNTQIGVLRLVNQLTLGTTIKKCPHRIRWPNYQLTRHCHETAHDGNESSRQLKSGDEKVKGVVRVVKDGVIQLRLRRISFNCPQEDQSKYVKGSNVHVSNISLTVDKIEPASPKWSGINWTQWSQWSQWGQWGQIRSFKDVLNIFGPTSPMITIMGYTFLIYLTFKFLPFVMLITIVLVICSFIFV